MDFERRCEILDKRIREKKQKNNFCFVLCDKFWRALRNSIPYIPSLTPDIVIAERWNKDSEFVLENSWVMIWSRHYLDNGDGFSQLLSSYIGLRRGGIFSWVRKNQLWNVGEFLCENDQIRSYVEDKTRLCSILEGAGIDVSRFTLRQNVFESRNHIPNFWFLVKTYGLPFVLQWWSKWGDGTIIVQSESDFIRKESLSGSIRVSEFCREQYSSIYACVLPDWDEGEVIMDRPSLKVVWLPQNGISNVFWGGCDWSQRPDIDVQETYENVRKIWIYLLRKFWYKWALMLEWFLMNGRFVFNELNARLGWGNEVSGFNQILHGEIPIQALHYSLQLAVPCADLVEQNEFHEKHFHAKSGGCFYVKVIWKSHQDFQVGNLVDAWYNYNWSDFLSYVWRRDPHHSPINRRQVLLSNLPRWQTWCRKDAHICMIEWMAWPHDRVITWPRSVSDTITQISELIYNSLIYAQG